mmetsp:Transcript_14830/g.22222  ORF Transcript_14830/g.22222 Transcript_14830/m.22222 type:complete len:295 (-) Transcript_14830:51-935(-)
MVSLTPTERSAEVTAAAMQEGLFAGALTLIPSTAAVYAALRNPKFVRSTNWQSRTALVIMPPLFMFAISAETKLSHSMKDMAKKSDYSREVSEWAERKHEATKKSLQRMDTDTGLEKQLHEMYKQSVEQSGVRIVPGDSLGAQHKIANFWQANPFKILAGVGIPTVLYIFRGRNDKKTLQLQSKLMHTRVYGQFAVLSMLLGLMGFKNYMDSHGKYITQYEADMRVEEMKVMRSDLLARIEFDKSMTVRRKKMLSHEKDQVENELKKDGLSDSKSARVEELSAKNMDVIAIEDA